jgi:hypothetical protein
MTRTAVKLPNKRVPATVQNGKPAPAQAGVVKVVVSKKAGNPYPSLVDAVKRAK